MAKGRSVRKKVHAGAGNSIGSERAAMSSSRGWAKPFWHLASGSREVVGGLQIHPKFGGIPEIFGKHECGLRGNASLPANQFVHPVQGNGKRPRQFRLGQAQRLEKFL
jgi:hypothetical protein